MFNSLLEIPPVSFVLHTLEFFVIAGLVVVLGLAAAFLLARRYVRRHWRCCTGTWPSAACWPRWRSWPPGRERYAGRATPEDLSRGAASRVRRRMWVAVEDAEIAVAHAESHDAPVAELPAVCRSLRGVAGRAGRAAPPGAPAAPGRGPGRRCAGRWPR